MSATNDRCFPLPDDESARLLDLMRYRVVGTPPECQFDEIAELTADLFDVPMALVSLVDGERQWFKARVGLDIRETPRSMSFCTYTILSSDVFCVPDALDDPRFSDNPLVLGAPNIRFYAGAPLVSQGGARIGSLCIIDTEPRPSLTASQARLLARMAKLVVTHLAQRRASFVSALLTGFAERTPLALVSTDDTGTVVFANAAAETLLGYANHELVGQRAEMLVPERFRDAHTKGVTRLRGGADSTLSGKSVELPALRCDGTEVPVEFCLSAWHGPAGLSITSVMTDISERRRRDAKLLRLAHHDALTGLPNRIQLNDALGDVISVGGSACLLMIDLDGFKEVNDCFGHPIGDALLQSLAVRLAGVIEPMALLARFGGDEFVVVLPSTADPLRVDACASAILHALARPFDLSGHRVMIGASIGAAISPCDGDTAEDLLASADMALYRAKSDGGQRFRLFDGTMRESLLAMRSLQDELRRALSHGQFELHYQPQVSLRTGETTGAEALIRWRHPERGLLLPGVFLQAIEAGSMAVHIGWWTLNEACRQVAEWRAAGLTTIRVAVNLFAAQIRAGNLPEVVDEVLARHGLPPEALELEITETIALQQDGPSLDLFAALHRMGVGLAFDDFGTGYASLSTLRRVPISVLKIDRSFVRDLLADNHDKAIVQAMIAIGRDLDIQVIAEGVETVEQAALLTDMACASAQGYLYGKAMPPDEFCRQLQTARTLPRSGSSFEAVA